MCRTILLLLKDFTTQSIICILVPMLGLLLSAPDLKEYGIAAITFSSDIDGDQIVDSRELVVLADMLTKNILIAQIPEGTGDVSVDGQIDFAELVILRTLIIESSGCRRVESTTPRPRIHQRSGVSGNCLMSLLIESFNSTPQ